MFTQTCCFDTQDFKIHIWSESLVNEKLNLMVCDLIADWLKRLSLKISTSPPWKNISRLRMQKCRGTYE